MFVCFFIIGFDTITFLPSPPIFKWPGAGCYKATESLPPWTQTASRTCLVWQSGQTTELMFMDQAWEVRTMSDIWSLPSWEPGPVSSSPCSVHAWQPINLSAIWSFDLGRGHSKHPNQICLSLQLLPPFMEKHDPAYPTGRCLPKSSILHGLSKF